VEGLEEGGAWLPPVGNSSGGATGSGPDMARAGGTRVRTVASGRARGREAQSAHGPAGEGNGVG
jgi:hypothetical protein